ncbi:transglutaminase family protein [Nevskia soli]|uniref:transglutaminase family protein n=1 Tax=Nevskia soli TaxID=418856 RepID=UPI000A05D7E4|nr:transglutaminase family protein [Nevskia soli]
MPTISVLHKTTYRYAKPVRLGQHRMMCRPRDSHDLRLIDTRLTITPQAHVRWMHDVFANSIAVASFDDEPATELCFESRFDAEHYPVDPGHIEIDPYASVYPFHYGFEEMPDLVRTVERHYPDPERRVDQWARAFLGESRTCDTMELLMNMNRAIKEQFPYARREEVGTQTPLETLDKQSGSCRDFALFMMEAVRSLGFAARFVSGYLYDEELLAAESGVVGGGATHAWMQVFLPGAGWVEFDPTNALAGGRNLIRVAVARDAAQAAPLTGSFTGAPADFLGMTVEVTVTAGGARQNQVQNQTQNPPQDQTQNQSRNRAQDQIQTQNQNPGQSARAR